MEKFDQKGRPVPFDIEFVSCNRTDKTGGELIRLEKVILAKNAKKRKKVKAGGTGKSKPANQWRNGVRNLLILSSNQIRKCRIRLITELNGHTIVY